MKQRAILLLRDPANAALLLGDIPNRPAILSHPDLTSKKIQAHEMGHYIDAIQHNAPTRKEYEKVYGAGKSHFRSLFEDPKKTPLYRAEERA